MTEAIAQVETPVEAPKPLNDDSVHVDEYVRRRMEGETGTQDTSEAPPAEEAKKSAAQEPAQPPKGSDEGKSKAETEAKTEKPETPAWVQKRIDKLTAARKEAEDRAEALQAELDKAKRTDKTATADESDPEPTPDKFKTYEEYVKAQSRWETRQELRERAETATQEAEQARAKETFNAHNTRIAEARAKIEDYDEVVNAAKFTVSRDAGLAIIELDNGPEVMYHLASHPEELEALSQLSPIRQIAKLGQISASLLPSASVDPAPKPKATTKAPEPITPVTATSSAKKPLNSEDISMDEYYRRRMADKNKSRR